eukprot:TRINITY_DN11260_c0_g5_i1.p1 TRINITY_DN11260_c0_g5~~TRINITY_DN11260_c0_g5_i1.p1  ORF type:complete len:649 (+),score=64.62 TRINITY_DN11260_c0_g5_i1:47-1993(+)
MSLKRPYDSGTNSTLLQEWRTVCLREADRRLYDTELEPTGLAREIQTVEKHILKTDGSPPFLVVKAPRQSGKSSVVTAALQRVFRKIHPWKDIKGSCSTCGLESYMCNSSFIVITVDSIENSAEAFKAVVSGLRTCGSDNIVESYTEMKRDKDTLTSYLETYSSRVVIWITGELKPYESRDFLYYITNLIHNKSAISRVSMVIETCTKLSGLTLDARVVSRISKKVIDFRGFTQNAIAEMVSNRLTLHSPDLPQKLPIFGVPGEGRVLTVSLSNDRKVLYVKIVTKGEPQSIASSSAVEVDENGNVSERPLEIGCDKTTRGASKITSHHELWPPRDMNITGVWLTTTSGGDVCGMGLLATGVKQLKASQLAVKSWNAVVSMIAGSPLLLKPMYVTGSFNEIGVMLKIWIGRLLSNRNDLLTPLASHIDGLTNAREIAQEIAPKLAFHFYATSRFEKVPREFSIKCADTPPDDLYADEVLAEGDELLAFEGCYSARELSNLTNLDLMLLCHLFKLHGRLQEAELKRNAATALTHESGDVGAAIELLPCQVIDSYRTSLLNMTGSKGASVMYDIPYHFENGLAVLLSKGLIRRGATRIAQKITDSKVHLNVDKVSLLHYLRAQRDAGSKSCRPHETFVIMTLDQDISLVD